MESIKLVFSFIFGVIVGGLFGTFVVPLFWKPKA